MIPYCHVKSPVYRGHLRHPFDSSCSRKICIVQRQRWRCTRHRSLSTACLESSAWSRPRENVRCCVAAARLKLYLSSDLACLLRNVHCTFFPGHVVGLDAAVHIYVFVIIILVEECPLLIVRRTNAEFERPRVPPSRQLCSQFACAKQYLQTDTATRDKRDGHQTEG